ncbi:hypothetical protein ACFSYD_09690 [Paracoccus aerius]
MPEPLRAQTWRQSWSQFDATSISTELAPVPLPATGALLAAGIAGLACFRWAQRNAAA